MTLTHRITESLRLEKTSKIIKSNRTPAILCSQAAFPTKTQETEEESHPDMVS